MIGFLKKRYHSTPLHHSGGFSLLFFSFWATIFLLVGNVTAGQTNALTAAELATIDNQLERAGAVSVAMNAKVECFATQDTQHEERIRVLQSKTGELYNAKKALTQKEKVAGQKESDFSKQVADTQHEIEESKSQLNTLQLKLDMAKAALEQCKHKFGIFGFLCNFAAEISGLQSDVRKMRAEQQGLTIQLNSKMTYLRIATKDLKRERGLLAQAQAALKQNRSSIAANEADLKSIKSSLSALRSAKQEYASKKSTFDATYEDFQSLDPHSDRRFVIHQLRIAYQEMAVSLPIAEAAVKAAAPLLSSGISICTG